MYTGKRDTDEILVPTVSATSNALQKKASNMELKPKMIGSDLNVKLEEQIAKQKQEGRRSSRDSKDGQSARQSEVSGRSGSRIGSARKRVGSARSSARNPQVPKPATPLNK